MSPILKEENFGCPAALCTSLNQYVLKKNGKIQGLQNQTKIEKYHHAICREPDPYYKFFCRFVHSLAFNLSFLLWAVPFSVIKLYVLVLLGYYFCLNFSCSVCCTANKNENRCASKSPKCSQVCGLFNHGRTSSEDRQKG